MNEIYSITKQYHEKNCVDIWIVRLGIRVDNKTFGILKRLAKDRGGYYSIFKGVNGFVFKDETDANDFGEELYALVIEKDESDVDSESENNEQDENVEVDMSDETVAVIDEAVAQMMEKPNDEETFANQLPSVKLDSKPQTPSTLRPSIYASEDVWDYYLSNRIIWKIDPLAYGIEAKASVSTDKGIKSIRVFIELNNCKSQNIRLYATLYDINGLIKESQLVIYGNNITGFKVDCSGFCLKCSITKIDKIIISGEITESCYE